MKTKFTKVAVEERLPKESGYYFGIDSLGNIEYPYFDEHNKNFESPWETQYFLEESPDREDEMREMLEKIRDGKIRPREYVSEWDILNDFIESLKHEK